MYLLFNQSLLIHFILHNNINKYILMNNDLPKLTSQNKICPIKNLKTVLFIY